MSPFVDIHTHRVPDDESVVAVVSLLHDAEVPHKGLYSVGIHPWALDEPTFDVATALDEMSERLLKPNVVAVGEVGLDKAHRATIDMQIRLLDQQIELSEQCGLPLILHNVRCDAELIALRKRHKASQTWVVHGFAGGVNEARQLMDKGFMLSIGTALLDMNRKVGRALYDIGRDNAFFETDTSPMSIDVVYRHAALLLSIGLDELKELVWTRARLLFGL